MGFMKQQTSRAFGAAPHLSWSLHFTRFHQQAPCGGFSQISLSFGDSGEGGVRCFVGSSTEETTAESFMAKFKFGDF